MEKWYACRFFRETDGAINLALTRSRPNESQEAAQEAVERELLANGFPEMIRGPLSHRLH
jgi:hypothetical protein